MNKINEFFALLAKKYLPIEIQDIDISINEPLDVKSKKADLEKVEEAEQEVKDYLEDNGIYSDEEDDADDEELNELKQKVEELK